MIDKKEYGMEKERYETIEMTVTQFDTTDIIVTSSGSELPIDPYPGEGVE